MSQLLGGEPSYAISHRLSAQVLLAVWVITRTITPAKKSRRSRMDGLFDALVFRLLEDLGLREVGVVRTTPDA